MATKKSPSPTKTILDLASRFVQDQQGAWEHKDWEAVVKKVEETGVAAEDELKRHFGNLLEAAKYFYHLEREQAPEPVADVPRSAKPRAKAKAKAKPRSKPSSD